MEEYSKITIPVDEYKKLIETRVRVELAINHITSDAGKYVSSLERELYRILTGEKLPEKEADA